MDPDAQTVREPDTETELNTSDNVVFRPNPGPQTDFFAATEREVLFGGAAGGGKSYALLVDPLRYLSNSHCSALLLRRTTEELRELRWKSQLLYPKVFPDIKWSERNQNWVMPNGGRLWLSYLDRDEDVLRYQGQAFNWIGFDELTQWATPFPWEYLRSRLRTTAKDLPLYMRACVDEGDVLTTKGWKKIQDVVVGEKVASVNSNGCLEYKTVKSTFKFYTEEDLIRLKKKNFYASFTSNHKLVYQKYGKKQLDQEVWENHQGKSISLVRSAFTSSRNSQYNVPVGQWDPNTFAEFLGLFVAEGSTYNRGHHYKNVITQLKEENHSYVKRVMSAGGYSVYYSKNGDFQITSKELYNYLAQLGKANTKHFPRSFLENASVEQIRLAFEAYMLGDGHKVSDFSSVAVTTSKQLVDDLQEIAVILNLKTQVTTQHSSNPRHATRYNVYFTARHPTTKIDKDLEGRNDVSSEKYKGFVYCLEVESNHNFVIRQKGCVWVSGNSTNPGNRGAQWVRKMFIEPAPFNTPFPATDIESGEPLVYPPGHKREGEPLFYRRFIPSRLQDNPYLYNDGEYEANLLSLPEIQRKQLLDGSWDTVEGAAFPEFNRHIHVIEPFEIPRHWRKFRAMDYGYGSYSGVVWFAIHPSGQLIVYRDLEISRVTAWDLADLIRDIEEETDDRVIYGVLDFSIGAERGQRGPTLVEQLQRHNLRWRPADRGKGSRIAGKNMIHRLLQVDEFTGEPSLVFFNTAIHCIAQLPVIPVDKNNPEDVDTKGRDHIYDAIRYGVMSRPRPVEMFGEANSSFKLPKWQPADQTLGY